MPQRRAPSKPTKTGLHPRNRHRNPYDFDALCKTLPALQKKVMHSPRGDKTIAFDDAEAVILLNRALLQRFYKVREWHIPTGNLCPPIPGRVDYIHYLNDLIEDEQQEIRVLDIGTGANVIYPLLAAAAYKWHAVGSDISASALQNAQQILDHNPHIGPNIELRQQTNAKAIFQGIMQSGDYFHATLCNPPFHASAKDAAAATSNKTQKLNKHKGRGQKNTHKATPPSLNFGGQHNELWCDGGELAFIQQMMTESQAVADQVGWFTCLISKQENLPPLQQTLQDIKALDSKIIKMHQGQKHSRFIAWRFNA